MSNRKKTTIFYGGLIAVAFTAIGMVIASRLDLAPNSSAQTIAAPPMNSAPVTGAVDAQTFRNIARMVTPSVVNISTESKRRSQEMTDFFGGDDLFRRFFGQPDPGEQQPRRRGGQPRDETVSGAGTGFIIDDSGLILTNNHVVADATRIQVGFFDGEDGDLFDAKVVGRDPLTDSALIQLVQKPTFALKKVNFGDSSKAEPGDWVMAIGNPFNFAHTVTVGVISATNRPFPVADSRSQQVLQTDAAINPGNSGGPLLNIRGDVIGINTAILANQQASNLGIGFAIPINLVRELLPELRAGKVTRGRIGLSLQSRITAEAAKAFGLPNRDGAVVTQVTDDTPAARAGFKPGDVIVEYNGKPVKESTDLVENVVRTKPGTTVPVKIIRDKQPKTLNVTVEELNLEAEAQTERASSEGTAGFGMTIDNLTPQAARGLRLPSGTTGALVVDLDPSGAAARAGVRPNDVILEVNRQPVSSAADAIRLLQRVQTGEPAFLLVHRGGSELFLTVTKR